MLYCFKKGNSANDTANEIILVNWNDVKSFQTVGLGSSERIILICKSKNIVAAMVLIRFMFIVDGVAQGSSSSRLKLLGWNCLNQLQTV